jgi:hypothetical protein
MQGGDEYKRKAPIKKKSERRKRDEVHYKDHCIELTNEIKEKNGGKIFCFFSGLEIVGRVTYHHLRGRTGDFYTDKEWLVPCINDYHLMFHWESVDFLLQQDWYVKIFLPNLKAKSEELYDKQIDKKNKYNPINPQRGLFDDED